MKKADNVILFDLDNTLVDWDEQILKDMNSLRSENEPEIISLPKGRLKNYLRKRMDFIMQNIQWWENLKIRQIGMDIWNLAGELEFERVILTQGPRKNPKAWTGKKLWVDKNLGQDTKLIITRDKTLVDGAVLVDDWPLYIIPWLKEHPTRHIILPMHHHNTTFTNKQAIKYTGKNLSDIRNLFNSIKP